MNGQMKQEHDYRFVTGLAVGGAVGAALALWLVPRAAAELKARTVRTARTLGDEVSAGYREARLYVTDAVDGLTRKGQSLRDDACDTVARGAHSVEQGARHVEHGAHSVEEGARSVEQGARDVQRHATNAKTHSHG